MKRKLIPFFSALSLLLCVGVLFLWWRSGIVLDLFTLSKDRQYFLVSCDGYLRAGWSSCDAGTLVFPAGYMDIRPVAPTTYATSVEFRWDNDPDGEYMPTYAEAEFGSQKFYTYGRPNGAKPRLHYVRCVAAVPHWLLASLLGTAAAPWIAFKVLRFTAYAKGS